ncbi:Calcineurin-like phosphoesterase [Gracilibacillus orientalis]|uniref:Calcineurin-like phosphoesterase n=1 Tax=Gracilibacillus orientalis TaxID=334253 RepID=A0A1I4J1J1_9BACI|nr:metallophosphoesterase [Gracilibacillus orientalis]SFL60512.1 Calcineurin-like phosphoesterase [Gracilibacillus orientalis]
MFNSKKAILAKLTGFVVTVGFAATLISIFPTASVYANGKEQPKLEFGVVPDVQYCDCEVNGTRYYRNSVTKLIEASQTLNQENVDFTVQLGDLIDRDVESISTILPIFNMIEGPKHHVLGNHDFAVKTDEVIDILGMKNQYYDFKYKNWRFVVLDTNDLSFYANSKDSEKYVEAEEMYNDLVESGAIQAQTYNGGISVEQLTWLHDVLDKAAKRNEKVVVFGHMPVYPENPHNVWNAEEVKEALEANDNVVAYFNGHNHAGNYGVQNGTHYVNLQGMVETEEDTAYSIIRIYKDRLEIDGYGREADRVLEIQ